MESLHYVGILAGAGVAVSEHRVTHPASQAPGCGAVVPEGTSAGQGPTLQGHEPYRTHGRKMCVFA